MTPDSNITPPMITPDLAARLIGDLTAIVARASVAILAIPYTDATRRTKPDQSSVTAADEASEVLILESLARLLPNVPVVSEEMTSHTAPPVLGECFIVIDPLDGTREYLAGSNEFTINLAIVSQGMPIAGIIAAPARGQLWRGVIGHGAERLQLRAGGADQPQAIHARAWPDQDAVAAVSRSHFDADTDAFLARLGPLKRSPAGSALKFCQLAEGGADVYPRLAPTCEWDVAAGHAVLAAAGGIVTTPQAAPLAYGRASHGFRVPAFVAWADPAKARAMKL